MQRNSRLWLFGTCAVVLASLGTAGATPTFTANYTQDFNSMGTGTVAPTGWTGYSISGSHDDFTPVDDSFGSKTLPTGSAIKAGSNITTLTAVTPSNQKATTIYNWAVGGSTTERSLGTSPTGTAGMILELTLTNGLSAPVNQINVSYDIRRFSTTVNNNSGYATGNYGSVEELPGYWLFYSLDGGTTYTNVSSLNPTLSGSSGVIVPNTIGVTNVPSTSVTLSGSWNPGANLMLRWFDDNAQGPSPDQLLGLDNVVITPEPATICLLALGGLSLAGRSVRRIR